MEPESEITRFIQTWLLVFLSLAYCFFAGKLVSPGMLRFSLILPVVALFLLLPLRLTSIYLGGTTAFFIAWLATFKLLLFSFDRGPLASDPQISLLRFIAAGSLPIKITPKSESHRPSNPQSAPQTAPIWKLTKKFAVKALLMAVIFKLYDFKARLHPTAILFLYSIHLYIMLELILDVDGGAARAGLGLELEPTFNEPYLSTSLKDFWGKRWNLPVTSILRPTVYGPVMGILKGRLSPIQTQSVAVMATFGVSGIMHELMMYYLNRVRPTGEMSAFFLLHGLCLVAETAFSRQWNRKWHLPRIVSSGLTILFVMITAFWLFFPEFLRAKIDIRSFKENEAVVEFIESVYNGSIFRSFHGISSIRSFFGQLLSF